MTTSTAPKLTEEQLIELASIKVGDGATYRTALGGIYIPYTVIAVRRGGKEVDVQRDKTIVTPGTGSSGGWEDDADKTYEPDPNGRIETYTLRNNFSFIEKGQPKERWSSTLQIGYRRDWTDMSM